MRDKRVSKLSLERVVSRLVECLEGREALPRQLTEESRLPTEDRLPDDTLRLQAPDHTAAIVRISRMIWSKYCVARLINPIRLRKPWIIPLQRISLTFTPAPSSRLA